MPGWVQAWPNSAACWSPAMPAIGTARPPANSVVSPYTSLDDATAGNTAGEGQTSTPSATTPGAAGGPGQVTEKEFKIAIPSATLKPGSYTSAASNRGNVQHAPPIDGPGVSKAHTPLIAGGKHATLK